MKLVTLFAPFFIFFLFPEISFSQSDPKELETINYHYALSQEVKTLNLRVADYSMNTLGEMKDEFLKLEGKVISVVFDEINMLMEVKHNGFLPKKEVMKILTSYNILNTDINSYQ